MTEPAAWEFYRHMPVYLSNGRPLGRTLEVGHAVDYLHVQQGRFVIRDWYIPASAIREVTPHGVYLSVGSGDLRRNRWHVPPEAYLSRQGATPGYEYTSPADIPRYGGTEVATADA
jgi:hypothetical protein